MEDVMPHDVWIEAMGAVAGALGMIGFVPQVWQTIRRGTAGDLNLAMLVIFAANTLLWTIYGVLKHAWALAGSDAIILVLIAVLLAYKTNDIAKARNT